MELKRVRFTHSRVVAEYPPPESLCVACNRPISEHSRTLGYDSLSNPRLQHPEIPCHNYAAVRNLNKPYYLVEFEGHAMIETVDHVTPLMFGRHKGKKLEDVPEAYLNWMVHKYLDDIIRFSTELQRRKVIRRLEGTEDAFVGDLRF